jgi:hypothetical protein
MKAMSLPGFTADESLRAASRPYRSARPSATRSGGVIPAIPRCENCDAILTNCESNGWRPRAACNACNAGICDSSDENPGGRCWLDPISGMRICDL